MSQESDPFNEGEWPYTSPFKKDVLEEREKPLSEKDFIRESPRPALFPAWLWLFLITILTALAWGSSHWYSEFLASKISARPFLEVSNRDFSLFLWQFPSFLRSNRKQKTGYLTGFQYGERETMEIAATEEYVVAPPDLLFLYHTWHRLLASDFIKRPIPASEFQEFLKQVPEWRPQYWKNAPYEYVNWVRQLKADQGNNLQELPDSILPLIVRQAFQGWKNYFKEGAQINALTPTFGEVKYFLAHHPTYARNYWRNIEEIAGQKIAGPSYLQVFLSETQQVDEPIPSDQLASFLKVALFNAQQAEKGL